MSPDTPAQDPPKPTIPPRPALVIAGVLLVNVLVLTFAIDERDDFEAGVIWVLLALAASAAASAIPGAMNLNLSPLGNLAVTASGPIVIFFVVFVLKPGILNEDAPSAPTATPAFEFAMESAGATPVASPLASPVAPPLASPIASPVVIGSL